MAKQDEYVRYTVRIPADLYKQVQKAAGEKSINAEIVTRLVDTFEKWPMWVDSSDRERKYLEHEWKKAAADLAEKSRTVEMLQALVRENTERARERQESDELLSAKFNDLKGQTELLTWLKEEFASMSRERIEMELEASALFKAQAAIIERMQNTQNVTNELLRTFRDALVAQSQGSA